MAATFHPELTDDTTVHEHFLGLAAAGMNSAGHRAKS
jgi:glutamine amidotransferase PdxT